MHSLIDIPHHPLALAVISDLKGRTKLQFQCDLPSAKWQKEHAHPIVRRKQALLFMLRGSNEPAGESRGFHQDAKNLIPDVRKNGMDHIVIMKIMKKWKHQHGRD